MPSSVSITKTNKRPASFSRAFRHSLAMLFSRLEKCERNRQPREKKQFGRMEPLASLRSYRVSVCACRFVVARLAQRGREMTLFLAAHNQVLAFSSGARNCLRFIQLLPFLYCARNCIFLGINSLNIPNSRRPAALFLLVSDDPLSLSTLQEG